MASKKQKLRYEAWADLPETKKTFPQIPAVIAAEFIKLRNQDPNADRAFLMHEAYQKYLDE